MLSIPPHIAKLSEYSEFDHQLNGKYIAVVYCAMRHRDYVYYSAHHLGAKLIFIDSIFPGWVTPYAYDTIYCKDASNASDLIHVLEVYIAKQQELHGESFKLSGIVSFDDYSVVSAAYASEHFQLPTTPSKTVNLIKNKYQFRQQTQLAGIQTPQAILIDPSMLTTGDYDESLSTFPFPCVIKPIAGAGSHFVRRVDDKQTLVEILQQYDLESRSSGEVAFWNVDRLASTQDPSQSPSSSDQPFASFMIEELLVGKEVDIDLVVQNGEIKFMGIADNFPTKGPEGLFMESGGAQPSQMAQSIQDGLFDLTRRIIQHFGADLSGVFHFEAMWTDRGPVPIEMNLRLGGSEVLAFILAVYHVNLGIQALKIACGIPCEVLNSTPRMVCVSTNILACDSGYVRNVELSPELFLNPRFVGGMHRCWINQPLKAPPLGFQFLAWLVASGDTYEDAVRIIDELQQHFTCHIAPFPLDDIEGLIPGTQVHYLALQSPSQYDRETCQLLIQQGVQIKKVISHGDLEDPSLSSYVG